MKRKVILAVLCFIFLFLAIFSGIQLFLAWQEYAVSDRVYDDLSQYIQMDATNPTKPAEPATEPTETTGSGTQSTKPSDTQPTEPTDTNPTEPENALVWPVVDFESLKKINDDVVAWIYIPGTNINYPVVQGADNDHYLYRLVDQTYNKAGSIFMDYRNNGVMNDSNTVLYGHHMRNKTMFAQITGYVEQEFYDAHPYGMLLTPEGNYLVKFFSGYVTDIYSDAWAMRFRSDSEYAAWISEVSGRSYFSTDVIPTVDDRMVTLSTCTYEYDNARFVVHGILCPAAS